MSNVINLHNPVRIGEVMEYPRTGRTPTFYTFRIRSSSDLETVIYIDEADALNIATQLVDAGVRLAEFVDIQNGPGLGPDNENKTRAVEGGGSFGFSDPVPGE